MLKAVEPADLPFRKLNAERHFDALAYCPVCHSTEVQIVRTFTAHVNLTAVSDANGASRLARSSKTWRLLATTTAPDPGSSR